MKHLVALAAILLACAACGADTATVVSSVPPGSQGASVPPATTEPAPGTSDAGSRLVRAASARQPGRGADLVHPRRVALVLEVPGREAPGHRHRGRQRAGRRPASVASRGGSVDGGARRHAPAWARHRRRHRDRRHEQRVRGGGRGALRADAAGAARLHADPVPVRPGCASASRRQGHDGLLGRRDRAARPDAPLELRRPAAARSWSRRPGIGDLVAGPIVVKGTANVFEANVSIEVVSGNGKVLARTFTTATCGTGCRGRYQATLDLHAEAPAGRHAARPRRRCGRHGYAPAPGGDPDHPQAVGGRV